MFGWFRSNIARVDISKSDKIIIAKNRVKIFMEKSAKDMSIYADRDGSHPRLVIFRNAEFHIRRMEDINDRINQISPQIDAMVRTLPREADETEMQELNNEFNLLNREFNARYEEVFNIGTDAYAAHPLNRNLAKYPYIDDDNTGPSFFEVMFRPLMFRLLDRPEEEFESAAVMDQDDLDNEPVEEPGFFSRIRDMFFGGLRVRDMQEPIHEEEQPLISNIDAEDDAQVLTQEDGIESDKETNDIGKVDSPLHANNISQQEEGLLQMATEAPVALDVNDLLGMSSSIVENGITNPLHS